MAKTTLFHMWRPYKDSLIRGHNFYVEQAQKRLLSQFENIDEEMNEYGNEWLKKVSHHFDPDHHDPSSFYEQAYDESIEFGQMLHHMKERTRLTLTLLRNARPASCKNLKL